MLDKIKLLPDSVANQIAAGEVVQRPASAVKELVENAIDAGASTINLIVKNAGKTLIRVIDNGIGMSETDARLCLERHATSKINQVEDLFALQTMGFRGEAVPSIAAVSQMIITSRTSKSELATNIVLEGSEVISQEFTNAPTGTNISVKNLFFNIPARRNFLKSNPVETKHIIEEFVRIALANPTVEMLLVSDDKNVHHLKKGNFRQRIVGVFGDNYNQKLVPVNEKTDIVRVEGFVGKAEFARKTRGEQYLFVNNRFIKSPYLNHAIQKAYEELLPKDQFPSYFLKLEVDPAKIDINIHPTKTEVKFEEEKDIYAILRTAIRQALGKFHVTPSLDFEREATFDIPISAQNSDVKMPRISVDPNFNPFENNKTPKSNTTVFKKEPLEKNWENIYSPPLLIESEELNELEAKKKNSSTPIQIKNKYIISTIKGGYLLIHQQRAHERILIDELGGKFANQTSECQQLLFPEEFEISSENMALLESLNEELVALGFSINKFGKQAVVVNGIPAGVTDKTAEALIEELLEEFKSNFSALKSKKEINLIRSLAKSMAIKVGKKLNKIEMLDIIDRLFSCEMPNVLPNGKKVVKSVTVDEIDKDFN